MSAREKSNSVALAKPFIFLLRNAATILTAIPVTRFWCEPLFFLMGRRRGARVIDLSKIQRLLIVRLDEIGDITLTTAFLREVRRNLPDARITLVVKPKVYEIVRRCPHVDEVLVYDCPAWQPCGLILRHWRAFIFSLQHLLMKKFDLAIVPSWDFDLFYASFIAYFSAAPRRVGFSENVTPHKQRVNKGYDKLFTHIIADDTLKHEVEHTMDIIRFLGGQVIDDAPELWLDDESSDFATSFMREGGIAPGNLLIGVAAGSRDLNRMLPAERLAEIVARLISDCNAHVILFGDKKELPYALHVEGALRNAPVPRLSNLAGKATLTQTCACLKFCKLYVGYDTGLTHMAAALKVPVVEISSWPETGAVNSVHSPYRFHPWRVPHIVLVPKKPVAPCSGECVAQESHCILQIGIDEVVNAVRKLLSNPEACSWGTQRHAH